MFPGTTVAFWKFIPALLTFKLEPTLGSVSPYGKIISIFAAFNNLWEIVKDIVILVILYTRESSGKIFIFEIDPGVRDDPGIITPFWRTAIS